MNFLEKLDFLMGRYNLSRSSLSQKSGIPYTTIDGWYKKGYEGLKLTTLRKLADYFNTSLDYWIQDEITDPNYGKSNGFIVDYDEMDLIKKYRELDAHGKRIVDSVLDEETRRMAEEKAAKERAAKATQEMEAAEEIAPIRYIRHYLVPSAAGFASPVEGEDYEMIEAGPEVPANADFCIEISGDSMEPYIKDGQRVYVQRDVNVREFDDAGIWYYAGDVYCKQYCIDFSGALILLSANRKRRNFDKWISKEERVNVVCYGRVILPFKLPQPEP